MDPASAPSAQSSPRSNAQYRWTRAKAIAFIDALAAKGSVAAAARAVGMSRKAAYALRGRLGPEFAEAWDCGIRLARARRQARRRNRYGAAR